MLIFNVYMCVCVPLLPKLCSISWSGALDLSEGCCIVIVANTIRKYKYHLNKHHHLNINQSPLNVLNLPPTKKTLNKIANF